MWEDEMDKGDIEGEFLDSCMMLVRDVYGNVFIL